MKYIVIIMLVLLVAGFFIFEYVSLKSTAEQMVQDQTENGNVEQQQMEKQMDNYGGKIDDINNSIQNAYDESGI